MAFLMTATPISMHVMEKISLTKTGFVIQLHIAAMFLPSLVTGNLIKNYGHSKIMHAGVFLFLITILTSFFEQNFINYLIALVFLGFGWNFLFISGTSLLVLSYKENEKFKAQGFNDFIVYSIQATASLSAGVLLSLTSWKTMNLICIIFLILIVLSTLRADFKEKKLKWNFLSYFQLSLIEIYFIIFTVFIASIIRGFNGFGFSATCISGFSFILPAIEIVPIILASRSFRISIFMVPYIWNKIDWKFVFQILLGIILGTPIGIYLLKFLSPSTTHLVNLWNCNFFC